MTKKIVFLFLAITAIIISCELANKDEKKNKLNEEPVYFREKDNDKNQASKNEDNPLRKPKPDNIEIPKESKSENVVPVEPVPEPKYAPLSSYDKKALDDEILSMARESKKDPKTIRKSLRVEADGTIISRELGMFVIDNPNGEEVYLPDQL